MRIKTKGQGLVEYALLLALAIAIIFAMRPTFEAFFGGLNDSNINKIEKGMSEVG